jgi:hypothetical protein
VRQRRARHPTFRTHDRAYDDPTIADLERTVATLPLAPSRRADLIEQTIKNQTPTANIVVATR